MGTIEELIEIWPNEVCDRRNMTIFLGNGKSHLPLVKRKNNSSWTLRIKNNTLLNLSMLKVAPSSLL